MQQRDDIQGLRAVAVLAVLIFHADQDWLPGGFVGVDIFFVISGYLISSIILRKIADGNFSFREFYLSRIRRIVPAYLAMLSVLALCMSLLLIPRDFGSFENSLKHVAIFASNNHFARHFDYFGPATSEITLLHTWSLAVEMQFYLLLPALLVFVPRRRLGKLFVIASTLLLAYSAIRLAQGARQQIYFSLAARIPEFFVGSLAALYGFGRNWSGRTAGLAAGAGLILIAASFVGITEQSLFPGLLSLPPCLGAALLIEARTSAVNRLLSAKPLVVIGALSYSLYLWHWPILASFRYFFETYALPSGALAVFVPLTAALSYLSYRFVEQPFRRAASPKTAAVRAAAFGTALLACVVAAHALNGRLVPALPVEATRYAAPDQVCHGYIVGDCIRGDRSSDRMLLLLGDSHAAQLNLFADVVGKAVHAQIRVISASGCVNIDGFDVERISEWARASCIDQTNRAKEFLPSSDAVILAGHWGFHYTSAPFLDALDGFLSKMREDGKPLLVLAQTPMLDSNVQRLQRFASFGMARKALRDEEFVTANAAIMALVGRHPHAKFLDLSDDPVFRQAPFGQGEMLYYDKTHLNETGSTLYGLAAVPHLDEWLGRHVYAARHEAGPSPKAQ